MTKSIIIDFHAGCIGALSDALITCEENFQILSLSSHNSFLPEYVKDRIIIGSRRKLFLARVFGVRSNVLRGKLTPKDLLSLRINYRSIFKPKFDLAWVMFPPSIYFQVLKSKIAKHTVIIASHRMDLWISEPKERQEFWERLKNDIQEGSVSVFAANRFDAKYIEYFLGREIQIVNYPYAYVKNSLLEAEAKKSGDWMLEPLIGPAHVDTGSPVFKSISEHFSPPIKSIKQYYPNYQLSDLSLHKAIIVLPYSIYSISIEELIRLGVPLLFPSINWLVQNSLLTDVRLWPIYGNKDDILEFSKGSDVDPNSDNDSNFRNWIRYSSWIGKSNIHIWDSLQQLTDILNRLHTLPSNVMTNYDALEFRDALSQVKFLAQT